MDLAVPPAIDNGLTRIVIASVALSTPAPNLHRTIPQNVARMLPQNRIRVPRTSPKCRQWLPTSFMQQLSPKRIAMAQTRAWQFG
jgi:hypothetical protein